MSDTTVTEERTLVNYSTDRGVGIIELTNAPANTYSYEMMSQLDAAILKARFDDDVHVIVLRGAGEKFFSAGAEIAMLNAVTPTFKYYFCLHANETLTRLEQTPKLVIAALNGHTVGGGLEIALACDIRIAAASASLVTAYLRIGFSGDYGISWLLTRTGRAGAGARTAADQPARRCNIRSRHRAGQRGGAGRRTAGEGFCAGEQPGRRPARRHPADQG